MSNMPLGIPSYLMFCIFTITLWHSLNNDAEAMFLRDPLLLQEICAVRGKSMYAYMHLMRLCPAGYVNGQTGCNCNTEFG